MNIWLIQANEPIPYIDTKQRFFRTGMLAEELNKRGHRIRWFATTFDHYTKKQRFNESKTIKVNENFNIEMIWAPTYKKNISIKRIANHKIMAINFRKIIGTLEIPDLIYCSFPTIELAEEAIKYGEKNGVKVITDIRDLWPDIFFQNLSFPINYLAYPYQYVMNRKTKKIFRKSFCLNAISETALDWGLKKIDVYSKRSWDYSYFIGYKEQTIKKKSEQKNTIPFIGTIGNQINYKLICEIGKEIDKRKLDFEILICGNGPQMDELRKQTSNINSISLLGWIDTGEIQLILNTAFAGLIPYNDTFDFQVGVGNKFGEIASFHLPIIVTCSGEMERLVNDYDCGIYSCNAKFIVDYLTNLKCDPNLYIKTSKKTEKLFYDKLNAKEIYKNLVDYLENLKEKEEL